jgi:hypothetical protein
VRIVIAGGPKTGKTTLAGRLAVELGCTPRHTDSLIPTHAWSDASLAVASWFDAPGPWIAEGVAAPRALRKWLAANTGGRPADRVVRLGQPHVPWSTGQGAMAKGCARIWGEILPELKRRGVDIQGTMP